MINRNAAKLKSARVSGVMWLAIIVLLGMQMAKAQVVSQVPDANTQFLNLSTVTIDAEGNTYVLVPSLGRITRVNLNGTTVLYAGGGRVILDPNDPNFLNRSAEAFAVNLVGAEGMRFGPDGHLYVAESTRGRITRISREPRPGFEGSFQLVARVFAGNGRIGFFAEGDTSFLVTLSRPTDLVFDSAGNLYVADTGGFRVYRITPTGAVSVVAGNGSEGFFGDGGSAVDASIHAPRALALDPQGNLYIAMYDLTGENSRVRKVTPQGIISTVAGNGAKGFSGDAGPAIAASLNSPQGLAADSSGFVYIADSLNHRIRIITPNQKIQTIAGTGEAGDNGVGLQAIDTALNIPRGMVFNAAGDLLVADTGNFRVLRISGVSNAPRVTFDTFTPSVLNVYPGGISQSMQISVTRYNFTGNVGFSISGLPNTLTGGVISPGLGNTGTIALTAVPGALPAGYQLNLQAYALNSSGEAISAISTQVSVNIVPTPTLVVSPTSLTFNGVSGGGNPATQTVLATDAAFGVIAWGASRTTASGGNWLSISPTSGNGNTPLIVGVNIQGLAAGTYTGNVQVSAPGATGTPKDIPVTLILTPPLPLISTGGVMNNASYNRASLALAPGSIAAIFGTNLTNGTSCLPPSCHPTFGANGRLGTSMAGTSITVNGVAAPLFYATPGQVGIQIPAELGPGSVELRITTDGRQGSPTNITLEPTAPGIFTTTANGAGSGAITHANGSIVSAANPALPNEVLVLYATGLGGTTPSVPTGALPTEASTANAPVTLSVDGIAVTPDYAGLAGCCVGLNQVNFRVPGNVRTNTVVTVTINSGGRIGNPVTLQIGQ